jgi:hypothetical protein
MVMIPPENDKGPAAEVARGAMADPAVERPSPGAGLDAFDTLRRIARASDRTDTRSVLESARRAIYTGDQAGIMWIVAAQQLEHEGEMPRPVAAYLVASFAEDTTVATWESDAQMTAISRRIDEIERAHGLRPGQYWRLGEGPPEWRAAEREWEEAFDQRWQALLRRFGEHEMADLLEQDRHEFDRRVHEGEVALFG